MTHEELRDKLLDLAYGELSKREARKVEAHAAACEACGAELARMRGTRRTMSALPHEPAPANGDRILLAAAREAARSRAPRRRSTLWWGGLAAVSAVAVVAVSYRLLELRPGPLERDRQDALLGDAPYSRAPAPPPPAEEPAAPPAKVRAERMDRGAVPAPSRGDRNAPTAPRSAAAPEPAAPPPRGEPPQPLRAPPAPAPTPAEELARTRERESAGGDEAAPSAAPAPADRSRATSAGAPRSASKAAQRQAPSEAFAGRAAAEPDPADALVRYGELRDAGGLRGQVRSFPGCAGEAWRKVETDPAGRVVKYVREGVFEGRRLRIEHVYGEDGALSTATVRDLDHPGAVLDPEALGLLLPAHAHEAAIHAPPRCGR